MKIFTNTNNIQSIRTELKKTDFFTELENTHNNSKVLVGNFGYIIIPHNKELPVRKIYLTSEYYNKEINNYKLFKDHNILIPNIINKSDSLGLINNFNQIEIDNIRKNNESFKKITDISSQEIGSILSKIHEISFDNGKSLVHGNCHQSNFFIGEKGKLGIFDLVSMHISHIEYDFATIYFNSDFNDIFIENILKNYKYKQYFGYKKFYSYTLLKIQENIKGNIYLREENKIFLKKELYKIKIKLGNLT